MITVGVDLIGSTTTTAIPCSSYLSAQSAYEEPILSSLFLGITSNDYMTSFGRSPQCSTLVPSGIYNNIDGPIYSSVTYTQCPPNATLPSVDYWPAGVVNRAGIFDALFGCCGLCQILIAQVRVLYWPSGAVSNCSIGGTVSPSQVNPPSPESIQERAHSLVGSGISTTTISGYTLTSPTLYLQIIGTARVTDFCGQVGSVHTDTIIPVEALSTLSYDVPVGGAIIDVQAAITKPLNTADLACPTWGIEPPNGGLIGSIVGPPFLPIIAPPPELLSLDPAWVSCSYADGEWFVSYGIFDPPYALTPMPTLNQATSSLPPAVSAVSTDPATNGPDSQYPTPSGSNLNSGPWSPVTQTALISLGPVSTNTIGSTFEDPTPTAPRSPNSSLDPGASPESTNPQGSQSNDPTAGLGGIIYSAFGGVAPTPIPISFASETLTVMGPSAIAVDGETLQPGGLAVTQSNQVLSLDPSDSLIAFQPTQPAPAKQITTPLILTAGSQPLPSIPIPSGAATIAGSPLTPGGSAITVSGTLVSLAPSGTLVMGGSSILISNGASAPTTAPSPQATETGSETSSLSLLGNSAVVIGGHTLAPNDPLATVTATPLSLLAPGVIVIGGTSTMTLSPQEDLTIGSQLFPLSSLGPSAILIDSQTLAPTDPLATIGSQLVSLAASGALVVGGTQTVALSPAQAITIGSQAFGVESLGASAVAVAGDTLMVAGPAATVDGALVSLASGGVVVVQSRSVRVGASGYVSGTTGGGARGTGVGAGDGYNGTLFEGGATGEWRAGPFVRWSGALVAGWVIWDRWVGRCG
ncbi:hypothetical protein MMC27_004447 [Xylographa pallens]|nr:hypothetical protein [Xylographa pallens]